MPSRRQSFAASLAAAGLLAVGRPAAAQTTPASAPSNAPATFRAFTVTSPDGVTLACQEWGNPNGPEIVFIHGFSQCHLSWSRQLHSDLARDFRMISFDLRGHGNSSKPLDKAAYQESRRWADDIAAIMAAASLRRPVLVGWSYAGRVMSDYLMTHGEEKLSGLVYVGALTVPQPGMVAPALAHSVSMVSPDLATQIEGTRSFLRACFQRQPSAEDIERMLVFNAIVPVEVRRNMLGRPAPYEAVLKGLKRPMLVIHGEDDQAAPVVLGRWAVANVPGAQGSFWPGIGHSTFWEDAPRFNRELAAFVRAHWRAS